MITIELYWKDLTRKKQYEILEALNITNDDHNWDTFPIAILEFEDGAFDED